MRFQWTLTHRLVRSLQLLLPILVVVLVAVPAWNYLKRQAEKAGPQRQGRQLPAGVSVHTDGFTLSQTEGGRTSYTVRAKTYLGVKDNKSMLEDVDVTVYGNTPQDPNRTITGSHCTYDQDTSDFQCNGNVHVQMDERTTIRTEELLYNHRDAVATSPQKAYLDREGTKGEADRFEYGLNSGLLKLDGNVRIETAEHTLLQTQSGVFQQKENWATMSGGVYIQTPNAWIRGTSGRADLVPRTFKAKNLTVQDNVTAESHPKASQEVLKLRADWLDAKISPVGTAELVKTRGKVEIDKTAPGVNQRLSGGEIDSTLTAGKLDALEARQDARMVMGMDQTLESSQIWTNSSGTVQTKDKSTLTVGDSTIEGREFTIENGEEEVTFNTPRRATLKKGTDQESSADQTRARFDNRSNMLLQLVQTGNFQFRTPQYQGRAQSGQFVDGGNIVILTGSAVVNDSEKHLEAAEIRLNQNDNSFVATKNASTLVTNTDEKVLVKAARVEGGADSMLYTGNVQLWRGDTYIKAERLTASGQGGQGKQGQQNSKVHAEAAPNGRVQSYLQNVKATSDTMDYDESNGTIHYTGHVWVQKQDMIVEAPDVTVHFQDKTVTQMVGIGGVKVTRSDQSGSGERAVYEQATDLVTLTGKNAQVRDPERGLIQGPTVTMRNRGKNVLVQSGNGERTVSQHPVKK
jgi:LPS export ABC transporter protein LptC/lipopolysaccharide transport protein LptA